MKETKEKLLQSSRLLPQTYTTQKKEQAKEALQKVTGLSFPSSGRTFLVALELEKEDTPERLIKEELLFALEGTKIHTVVIGENPHSHSFKYINFVEKEKKDTIEKAADLFIWPREERELKIMHYGTVCLSRSNENVNPYNSQKETGDGFICDETSHYALFAEIVRAEESYKFTYDWKHICQNAMDKSYDG